MAQHGGHGGELRLQGDEAGGTGLSGLILLLLQHPGDGAAHGETPEIGSRRGLARSLQRAEAMLRSCVSPSLRRLLPARPRQHHSDDDADKEEEDDDDNDEESAPFLAPLEQSFTGLRRCLCVWEDPRTETFHGRVQHQPGDATPGTFTYHPMHPRVSERVAALHALLQHRHHLRLASDYSRRLKAVSDFLRRLLVPPSTVDLALAPPLRELCQELRVHAGHWSVLLRRMRSDPWLRPLLLRRQESVAHMRQALLLLALQATRLAERHIEAQLRALAQAGTTAPPAPTLLCDLFQGLEIYNCVVGDLALELGTAGHTGITVRHHTNHPSAFPAGRVLDILGSHRSRLVAEQLQPLLQSRDEGVGAVGRVCWENVVLPWPSECGTVTGTTPCELSGLTTELQALCCKDQELMGIVLGMLVASTNSLWHHVLHLPSQEVPAEPLVSTEPLVPVAGARPASGSGKGVRWLDAAHVPAASALHAQYRRLLWGSVGTTLEHRLALPPCPMGTTTAAALELGQALSQAGVPQECQEELGRLCLRLLCRAVLQDWDSGFTRALGSALSDSCSVGPGSGPGPGRSRTARSLQQLYPGLGVALRCLRTLPGDPPGLRGQVLSRCVATAQAAGSWVWGRACRDLAAWALPQFLLVTQGDLPLLKQETDQLLRLVTGIFPEPRDPAVGHCPPELPPTAIPTPQELQLCQQLHAIAASIQHFAGDVLGMFSTDCKRLSAEIFDQTMPLGRHWRLALRPELPSSPSAYAAAAAQAVLGQVLQGAQMLPRDAQAPALARVTTAFLEAWMDHILAQRIKFSLQGALQLRQDFELVRELLGSERYALAPETRQALLALRIFQQMDGAILCLLQQPGGAPRAWHSLRRCCSDDGAHPQEQGESTLHGLDTLDPTPAVAVAAMGTPLSDTGLRLRGGGGVGGGSESYLSGNQQQWLALRLHRARRWRVPGLPCVGSGSET